MLRIFAFLKSLPGSPVFWLVVANTAIYCLVARVPAEGQVAIYLRYGLSTVGLSDGRVWEMFTYAWLHKDIWHLLANMVCLWFAGRAVERVIGVAWFCALYGLTILGGAILQMLFAVPELTLMGASGAVCGVMLAFATIYWDRQIMLLLFMVLPLVLRGRYLGWIVMIFSVASIVFSLAPHIGHATHLGGALTGYLFARALGFGRVTLPERLLRRAERK